MLVSWILVLKALWILLLILLLFYPNSYCLLLLVPTAGFEPATCCLWNSRSTVELCRKISIQYPVRAYTEFQILVPKTLWTLLTFSSQSREQPPCSREFLPPHFSSLGSPQSPAGLTHLKSLFAGKLPALSAFPRTFSNTLTRTRTWNFPFVGECDHPFHHKSVFQFSVREYSTSACGVPRTVYWVLLSKTLWIFLPKYSR